MLTQNARDWGLISPWSTEFSFWLLIITNSTTYIWWPLRSLSLKHMRICFLLEGMNVIVVKCLDSLVVSCSPRMQETGDQFPIELQNFFGLLIVTNSIHCYKDTYPVHPWHNTLGECQQQCVIYTLPVGITAPCVMLHKSNDENDFGFLSVWIWCYLNATDGVHVLCRDPSSLYGFSCPFVKLCNL